MIQALRKAIQRMPCPLEVMPTCVRWYVAYPLSLRHIQDVMTERGVGVDHAAAHRLSPRNPASVRLGISPVQTSDGCQMSRNETDIKLAGQWKYWYRAVARDANTIDFLLRVKRDCSAALSLKCTNSSSSNLV